MPHKLLLADDSVTIQRVIELTFADEDIQVVTVGDGQQAIDRIDADRPDIVLVDVGMPEKDGYEVAEHVKRHAHLQHIPVVLLTGAFEPVDDARARAIGCDGVLVKPFEPQMVVNRVRDLLAGRRPASMWAMPPDQPARTAERAGAETAGAPPQRDYKELDLGQAGKDSAGPAAESLDEYFDRLDAAFATLGDEPPAAVQTHRVAFEPEPPPPAPAVDRGEAPKRAAPDDGFSSTLDRWDPSLSEGGLDPAVLQAAAQPRAQAPPPAPPPVAAAPVAPAPASAAQAPAPSLSDAFAALLAAEQAQAARPTAAPAQGVASVAARPAPPPAAPLGDEAIEAVVERVIQRMTAGAVRDTVLQVAERLVREEIARIKNQPR